MSVSLKQRFTLRPRDNFDDTVWNRFVEEVSLLLTTLQEKSASFDEARQQLIQATLFRVNEILLPAFSSVQKYQTGGFLVAPIADATEVEFVEGATAVVIHADQRAVFWPSPFVALTRASSAAEWALAQAGEYNAETGALTLTILAATGGGTHQDVIVSATAGSVMAQQAFLTDAKTARDKAAQWADKAENSAVEPGKYSAKHHALKAASAASTAESHKNTTSGAAGTAVAAAASSGAARAAAEEWAEGTEPGGPGTKSAKEHALDAAASASAAATFDPSSYTPTSGLAAVAMSGDYADLDGKPLLFSGSYDDLSGKPTLGDAAAKSTGTEAGTVAAGDDSRITGAAPKGAITASGLTMVADRLLGRTTASAGAVEEIQPGFGLTLSGGSLSRDKVVVSALSDGGTVNLDASLGDVFTLSAAGGRTISAPTNPTAGQKIVIAHTASGGARNLSLNTGTGGFRFGADITGLTATVSGTTDYIGAIYNAAANRWDVVAYAKGY